MEEVRSPGGDEIRKVNIDTPQPTEQFAVSVHPRLETDHTDISPRDNEPLNTSRER